MNAAIAKLEAELTIMKAQIAARKTTCAIPYDFPKIKRTYTYRPSTKM